MRVLLVILEGMADRPQEALGSKTPLEVATLPNLDALAAAGSCGMVYPVGPGVCPSGDLALWHTLGYGAMPYPGRAAFEALGAGIKLSRGSTVFMVNLASTRKEAGERFVQASPAALSGEQSSKVAASLATYRPELLFCRLHHLDGPYMAMVFGEGASPLVTDTDPVFYRLPVREAAPLDGAGQEAADTARELNRFTGWAQGVLASHEVNEARAADGMTVADSVLVKWGSTAPALDSFKDAWGFEGALSGPGSFTIGLAEALSIEALEGGAASPAADLEYRLESAADAFDRGHDFVVVRTLFADAASHAGRPRRKVKTLEEMDAALADLATYTSDRSTLLVVTSGLTAPSGGSDEVIHSGEAAPFVIVGATARPDSVASFDERSWQGCLGTINGVELMPLVLSLTNRARYGTSRFLPRDVPFRPLS